MLTISSPPVTDLEIELRAKSIREAIEAHRKQTPTTPPAERWTGVLVYPSTVARSHVVRMGRTLAQRLTESGVARDVGDRRSAQRRHARCHARTRARPATTCRSKSTAGNARPSGPTSIHPDIWRPFWIKDLSTLESELRRNARDKYSYRELKDFADRIRDRLKQSHYVAQIDMVGNQDEQVWLSYSGQRLNQFGITPLSIVDRVQERNINIPGGQVELPDQNVVVRPTGEYTSAAEIGQHGAGRVLRRLPALPARPGGGHARVRRPGQRDELPHDQGPAGAITSSDGVERVADRRRTRCRTTTTCRPAARSRSPCARSRARTSPTTTAT